MEEILEPEPPSTDDRQWRNNTEYQIINYIINYIENCDLLLLDYARHELESYSPRSEISAIIQIILIKNHCILNKTPVSLMNKIYSNHLQHRYLNTNIDYSSKEIREFIKFIDYDKENKSNFDFERLHLLNRQMIMRIEYERNKKDALYKMNREKNEIEKIEKETENIVRETYGKKPTCRIS